MKVAMLRNNGLSLVVFALFLLFWTGQLLAGWSVYNDEREKRHEPAIGFASYLTSAHALEATAENWESEFLQMSAFVILTAHLYQRGSPESRDAAQKPSRQRVRADSPWPVRRGGWVRRIYEHSLSLTLGILFLASLALHAVGGARAFNEDRMLAGESPVDAVEFVTSSQFWFESFQNWQSEFLAIGMMVVLTVFMREKDSPESKRVETPHHEHD